MTLDRANPPQAELEIFLEAAQRGADSDPGGFSYRVTLRFVQLGSDAALPPVRGHARFDLAELQSLFLDPVAYGRSLTTSVFADPALATFWREIDVSCQSAGLELRVRLSLDRSAAELDVLRWELLRHPVRDQTLTTSERVYFSRFFECRDWRVIRPLPKRALRALVAVAAPKDLATLKLAEVPRDAEIARVQAQMQGIQLAVLEPPVTLERLVDAIRPSTVRAGLDILYLVCHGALRRDEPFLFLETAEGMTARVPGAELAARVAELERPPRLIFLASCESAGREEGVGDDGKSTSQSALAPLLAQAGVPALVAMQGKITQKTIAELAPVFFRELSDHGKIDRALAIARSQVQSRPDAWMPALYLRLKSGRLFSDAGFAGGADEVKWRNLCRHVSAGRFVPILGPLLTEKLCGTTATIAQGLAETWSFPLAAHAQPDLPRLLQFIATREKASAVLPELQTELRRQIAALFSGWIDEATLAGPLGKLLDAVGELRRRDPDEPHRVLADLPARLYVTASADNFLFRALQAAGRSPQRLVCRWRANPPTVPHETAEPTCAQPAIFHLLGFFGETDSLVLTEDDYFDFLITAASDRLIPPVVGSALVDNSLLFLGFPLADWSFRVLFRLIMSLGGRERLKDLPHVGVQIEPGSDGGANAAARDYLQKYFGHEAAIDIFWGSAEDFLGQLRAELALLPPSAAPQAEVDDGWD